MPGWWDDDDYNPDEEDWLPQPVRYSIYGARWDHRLKTWTCICPQYRSKNVCRHTITFRNTDVIEPKEEYL